MVHRHPFFPAPAWVSGSWGEISQAAMADLLRRADAIFIEELRRHDLYDKVSQAFRGCFLPVRSRRRQWATGRRLTIYVIALRRPVETIRFS